MSETYVDSDGKKQIRALSIDFEALPVRHVEVITNLPGFEQDKELVGWMKNASNYYDAGEYAKAHQYLTWG